MGSMLERIQAIMRGELPPPPVATLLGLRLVSASKGEAVFSLDADRRHANPMGTLHGGVLCDLGDAAMGVAFASTCESEESYATIELKCNFLRPVWTAHLTAKAKVVYRGKTIGMSECDITDEQQRLVAKLSSTLTVLRGDAARGRAIGAA